MTHRSPGRLRLRLPGRRGGGRRRRQHRGAGGARQHPAPGSGGEAERRACLRAVLPATYQQGGDCVDIATELHRSWPIEAVVPALEYAVPAAAAIAESSVCRAPPPGPPPSSGTSCCCGRRPAGPGCRRPAGGRSAAPRTSSRSPRPVPWSSSPPTGRRAAGVQLLDHLRSRRGRTGLAGAAGGGRNPATRPTVRWTGASSPRSGCTAPSTASRPWCARAASSSSTSRRSR